MKKTFQIQNYELHYQTYEVEAESKEEALEIMANGMATMTDDELEFIQTAERYSGENMPDGIRQIEEV